MRYSDIRMRRPSARRRMPSVGSWASAVIAAAPGVDVSLAGSWRIVPVVRSVGPRGTGAQGTVGGSDPPSLCRFCRCD